MSDDANDVSKALAAFGAPSIRYHSFGQAQVKPSSVVLPRRVVPVAPDALVTRQEEALAPMPMPPQVPTPMPVASVVPPIPVQPMPEERAAPVLRQSEPLRPAEPLRQAEPLLPPPTVAPPPRPLAEWAAPTSPPSVPPPRPAMAPVPVRPVSPPVASIPPAPPPSLIVPPRFPPAMPAPTPAVAPVPAPVAAAPVLPPDVPAPHSSPTATTFADTVVSQPRSPAVENGAMSKKSTSPQRRRNLEEIFELLASAASDMPLKMS